MSQEELDALLIEWQKRLRLQDWNVKIEVVPRSRIEGANGECNYFADKKVATILIADACGQHYLSYVDDDHPEDVESTIVHELLHLHVDALMEADSPKTIKRAEEQLIHLLTSAILTLKRGNGHTIEQAMQEELPEPVKKRRVEA
jgi:hypothetical protein